MVEEKKFVEVLKNNAFREDLKAAETREEVQSTFAKYGVILDRNEVDAFLKMALEEPASDDVSEAELEKVSGGVAAWAILTTSYSIVKDVAKYAWSAGRKFAQWV